MMTIAEQLRQTDLFRDVDLADLEALAAVMQEQTYAAGHVLFNTGDIGDTMYIILEGRVRIYTQDAHGNDLTLTHYLSKQIFGEFSLLDNQPRSASAEAAEETRLLALRRDDFMDFLLQRPQVSLAMIRSLSQRARYTTAYLSEMMRWTRRLAQGEYQRVIEELSQTQGVNVSQIQGLIGAFLQMAQSVQAREEQLRQELARLQVRVDQEQRTTQVHEITKTDFFSKLREQAKQLRGETGSLLAPENEDSA